MTRPSTEMRDRQIMRHWREGIEPKAIRLILALSSVWVVYDTLRRMKKKAVEK